MKQRREKVWPDPDIIGQNYTSGFERIPAATEESLALLYHENSKHYVIDTLPTHVAPEPWAPQRGMGIPVSKHLMPPDSERVIRLPPVPLGRLKGRSLGSLLARRRSCRAFEEAPITLQQFATLLSVAYGVTDRPKTPYGIAYLRTVPSGGARFPLEITAIVRHVEGLAPGVYHYRPEPHYVEFLQEGDFAATLERATWRQGIARHAAVVILISAVWHRNMDKYGERGYRGILMEVGEVIQNLYLGAESLGLGCVALEGVDELWNELAGLDGFDETTLISVCVGPRAEGPTEFRLWE